MDNEIEFTMIEIKDIGKLQKSELVKDETFEAEITQVSDLSEAYCREIMNRVESMLPDGCSVRYIGCTERIGNYEFCISCGQLEYTVILQQNTYEWNLQLAVKIGYKENRNGLPVIKTKETLTGYDHLLEDIKLCIKNAIIRDWYKCVWIKDNQSLALSGEVYSEIYKAENELRAFINKVMIEHFGIEWNDRPEFYKLNASIEENSVNIKRNVPNFSNIDVSLYTVTLEKLMETIKADIYSDAMPDSPEIQKMIKERIFETTQLEKMRAALDFLKNRYIKKYNIWKRFFLPFISEPTKWEDLLSAFISNRNHVAHNKLLDYSAKEKMLEDVREFRKCIREAVAQFDLENRSEEVEETLQAIEDQREYERKARLEIIESESGVKIRDKKAILELFQNTLDDIYTDTVDTLYFNEYIEISEQNDLQNITSDQLLLAIGNKHGKRLEIYGELDIDDSEGAESTLNVKIFDGDENVSNVTIEYTNGEAEYYSEQASYMPVVQDQYDDGGAETIKEVIGEFLSREEDAVDDYLARRQAEEDWNADAADTLEDN